MRRIYIEREKCQGCLTCVLVCMNVHRKDRGSLEDLPFYTNIESRGHIRYAGGHSTPIYCRHCNDPECVATCMSGALQKNSKTGHVNYDKERCGQCFMCVMCCPFGLPKPSNVSKSEIIRCDFCNGIAEGPCCVASCPSETITVKEVE